MFLTATNLVHYLLDRGLVTPEAVVDGRFMVMEAGRRNRNYRVTVQDGQSLFVKQVGGFNPEAVTTLHREATVYHLAQSDPALNALADQMPERLHYDSRRYVLVLGLLDGETITDYQLRLRSFPPEVGTVLGQGLGRYHGEMGRTLCDRAGSLFPRQPPWVLSFYESGGGFTGGSAELVGVVQRYPEFQDHLRTIRDEWQTKTLIHGDMKWDNCLMCPREDGSMDLRILDWEIADLGDAAWDVGAIFQNYLTLWIASMPTTQESNPERFVAQAAYKIEDMQPAIRAFWTAYVDTRALTPDGARAFLLRAVRHGAARMVQSAFEQLYRSDTLSTYSVTLLQMSLNILRDPETALSDLYGFAPEGARAAARVTP